MKKHTIIFLVIVIYIMGIGGYGYYSYLKTEQDVMKGIEDKLLTASLAIPLILPKDYHDNIVDENSISKELYSEMSEKLNEYVALVDNLLYLTTFIKDGTTIRFTSGNYTQEEVEKNMVALYYDVYKENATGFYNDAFEAKEPIFENSEDKWGSYKTVLSARKDANGRTYIIGADMDISDVKSILRDELFYAILTGLFFLLLIIPIIMLYIRTMEREKKILELKVEQRTKELQEEHKKLQQAKKKITDNINFSAMIQNSILPLHNPMDNFFDDYFVIWEPKDIVGGDIYLFEEFEDGCLIMVADCMGHGVTGAFMTMITKAAFSSVVNKTNYNNPAIILSLLSERIKILLKQDRKDATSNTGLDGAIAFYDTKNKKVIFASAKTSIFYIQNEKLESIKPDKQSIGYKRSKANFKFTNHEVDISTESCFYIATDGMIDQYKSNSRVTFGKKRLEGLLFKNYKDSFKNQKNSILVELKNYQKDAERNDDITIFGFKLKS